MTRFDETISGSSQNTGNAVVRVGAKPLGLSLALPETWTPDDEGRRLLNERLQQIEDQLGRSENYELDVPIHYAYANANYAVPTTMAPVAGATLSLDKIGTWLLLVSTHWNIADNAMMTAYLAVDPSVETDALVQASKIEFLGTEEDSKTAVAWSLFTATSIPRLVQLYAKKASGAGSTLLVEPTHIAAIWLSRWTPSTRRFGRQTASLTTSIRDPYGNPVTIYGEEARWPSSERPDGLASAATLTDPDLVPPVVPPVFPDPEANLITDATAGTIVTSTDINGGQFWSVGYLRWTNPTVQACPLFYHSLITVQRVNAAGTGDPGSYEGTERPVVESDLPGETITTQGGADWNYPPAGSTYNRFRFRIYVVNRDPTKILQTTAWSGAAYLDVIPTPPSGILPGDRIAAESLVTAAFAATIRPWALLTSAPTLPDALYPAGSPIRILSGGVVTLYRVNAAGTALVKLVDGALDIVAKSISTPVIAAGAIGTAELATTEIFVGAGGGKPPKIVVVSGIGQMLAAIGDFTSWQGGFFINLRVGPDINAPVLEATASGVTINGAPFTLNANGITTIITNASVGTSPAGLQILKNSSGEYIQLGMSSTANPWIKIGRPSAASVEISLAGAYGGMATLTDTTGTSGIELYGGYYGSGGWRGHIVTGSVNCVRNLLVNTVEVINSSKQFVGAGVVCTGYDIKANGFNPYSGGVQYNGLATISQAFIYAQNLVLIRTNGGVLEYSADGGVNWYAVGAGGVNVSTGAYTKTITGYGGVITGIA